MSNNQIQKKANVPTLRFPEFEGEWERMRALELLDFFSTNSLSWEQLEYGGQDKLNLHYGLIHNGLPTLVNAAKDELPAVKPEFAPKKFTLCKEGDVAFADASEDTNDVGKVVEFVNCDGKDIVCGLHTIHGRDKEDKTVVGFKGYAFSSPAFHDQIRRIAQGTKIYSINTSNFDEVYIGIPGKEEQRRIVALLSKIDERIAIQNKIIEDLKRLKTGIENKCFGSLSGKRCSLDDILVERIEKTTRNNQHDILSSTVNGIFSQKEYFNKEVASADNTGYKVVYKEDIVLSPQNLWMGNINYNDRFNVGIVSPSYKVFSIKDGLDKQFIASLLKSSRAIWMYSLVSEQGASIVRRNLNLDSFMQLSFPIPGLSEQKKISNAIFAIAEKISLEDGVRKSLEIQKKSLLTGMFI